jgi:predicted transcriptional regulator
VSLPPDLDARVSAAVVVLDSSRSRLHRLALAGFLEALPADQRDAIQTRAAAARA